MVAKDEIRLAEIEDFLEDVLFGLTLLEELRIVAVVVVLVVQGGVIVLVVAELVVVFTQRIHLILPVLHALLLRQLLLEAALVVRYLRVEVVAWGGGGGYIL